MNRLLYQLPSLKHIDAKSVDEAVFWLRKYGDKARVIAGGTDLLGLMKDRVEGPKLKIPEILVNIKTIPEINRITYDDEGDLRIGATVTLNRLETSDVIKKKFNILSQAARQVGSTQIRNMVTIGGNLCQRPRCMYFRHPHFLCHKKGGVICYTATGEHRYYNSIMRYGICKMAHPSDMATVLSALKAKAIISSPEGTKQVPLQDFFSEPDNFTETILKPDELLMEVQVPNLKGRTHQLFFKHRIRQSTDFSLSSLATVAQLSNEICKDIRIVLGGIAPFPYVASKAEEIVRGRRLNEELISRAADASTEEANLIFMNRYKIDLTKSLVRRALTSILNDTSRINVK